MKKAKQIVSMFLAFAMSLCFILPANAIGAEPAIEHSDVLAPFMTVSFNANGTALVFSAIKGGVAARTVFGFVSDDDLGNVENVEFFGGISIENQTPYAVSSTFAGAMAFGNHGKNKGGLAGAFVTTAIIPEKTRLFTLEVKGKGRINILGHTYIMVPDEDYVPGFAPPVDNPTYRVAPFNISVSNERCDKCPICTAGGQAVIGHIKGGSSVGVSDALEVLKDIVGMDNAIDKCEQSRSAALITKAAIVKGEPSVSDALEILKKIVSMPNLIDNPV